MKRIRQWIDRLSVKKKLVLYGYLTITPVVLVICLILTATNYQKVRDERLEAERVAVHTLAESWDMQQTDIKDFSTYICINQQIRELLTATDPEEKNKNARLWMDEAPMEIVQDMIALKGYITAIAIYPENGVRPYLRGIDGSVNVSSAEELRRSQIWQDAQESTNGMVWKYVPKGSGDIYKMNRSDKIVLYREIRDLAQKKILGHVVIGVKQECLTNLVKNVVREDEAVLVLDKDGGVLGSIGTIDEGLLEYLQSDDFVQIDNRERAEHFPYGSHEVICRQPYKNSSIVCKIVQRENFRTQIKEAMHMPLNKLSKAITDVAAGDFEQQVEVTTHDEIGEVAQCFNTMVRSIRELIEQNYVITLQEKESELAALQAQINPHFLYNTLDSLYWQAMEAGNEEVAESILALSQLFRLVLNQGV